jgi:hypothetical protein
MRWRQVTVLWVVAALLGAQYVLVDRRTPVVHPAERPVRPRLLPSIAVDTVVGVRLEQEGVAVALRRHGEAWAVEQPTGGRVAAGLIQAFVESLTAVEEIERFPRGAHGDGDLGFGDGALRLHVLAADGRELHLTVGSRNAAGTAVYARLDDAGDAVLIGRNVEYYASLILQEVRRSAEPAGEGPIA